MENATRGRFAGIPKDVAAIFEHPPFHSYQLRQKGKDAEFLFHGHNRRNTAIDHCAGTSYGMLVSGRRRVGNTLPKNDSN
jgi:hypothetical protein